MQRLSNRLPLPKNFKATTVPSSPCTRFTIATTVQPHNPWATWIRVKSLRYRACDHKSDSCLNWVERNLQLGRKSKIYLTHSFIWLPSFPKDPVYTGSLRFYDFASKKGGRTLSATSVKRKFAWRRTQPGQSTPAVHCSVVGVSYRQQSALLLKKFTAW